MAFETEPLVLEPLRWMERPDGAGIMTDAGLFIPMPTPEAVSTMQRFLDLAQHSRTPPTFQQLTMQLARWGVPLAHVKEALEILCAHRLIKNRSAYRLTRFLRETYRWRDSWLNTAIGQTPLVKLPAGYSHEITAHATVVVVLLGSFLFWMPLFHSTEAWTGHPWQWLLSGVLAIASARSLRSLAEAAMIRMLTGQAQALTLNLGVIGPWISCPSIEFVEKRTAWEGWAAVAALATMPAAAIGGGRVAVDFALLALLIETAPFAASSLNDIYRYFFSLSKDGAKPRGYPLCAAIWVAAAAVFAIHFSRHVSATLTDTTFEALSPLDMISLVLFLALPTAAAVAWLEDAFRGAPHILFSPLREADARFRPVRGAERPRRRLSEFEDPEMWAKLPVLRQLAPEMRDKLLAHAELREYPAGHRICKQGRVRRELFVLLSGEALIVRRSNQPGKSVAIGLLEENAMFGETGFFLGKPRTADVIAVEDSVVLAIKAKDATIMTDTGAFQEMQTRIWLFQAMQNNPLFNEMPAEAADFFAFQGRVEKIPAGARWIHEGESATCCYCLIQGAARVFQKGKEIRRLAAGDIIGEIALLQPDTRRTASVTAETDLLAIRLDFEAFWHALTRHFAFGLAVERMAKARLAEDQMRQSRRSA